MTPDEARLGMYVKRARWKENLDEDFPLGAIGRLVSVAPGVGIGAFVFLARVDRPGTTLYGIHLDTLEPCTEEEMALDILGSASP